MMDRYFLKDNANDDTYCDLIFEQESKRNEGKINTYLVAVIPKDILHVLFKLDDINKPIEVKFERV